MTFDWVAAILIAAWASVYRVAAFEGLHNDHFVTIARAFQMLYGDLPVRDFFDPGMPLAYLLPAAGMRLFGATLFPEVLLSALYFGLTAGIVFFVARRASGNVLLALALALLVCAFPPRYYNSSKVFVQVAAIALAWWYAAQPRLGRLAVLAAWTAVAFLFRHDYAVYIGIGVFVLVGVSHYPRPSTILRHLAFYAALSLLCVLPWLAYVQWAGGLVSYFESALRFSAAEADRTTRVGSTLLMFAALPVAALLLARRGTRHLGAAHLAFLGVFVLVLDVAFLRSASQARVPDAIAPSLVVAAAVLGALPIRLVMASALAASVGVGVLWHTQQYISFDPGLLVRRADQVSRNLVRWYPSGLPTSGLPPIIDYLQQCTAATDRVLVVGFAPQVPVLAHRPFAAAAPAWFSRYYTHESDVRFARRQLERETVGAVLLLDNPNALTEGWPELGAVLVARGFTPHIWHGEEADVTVWLPKTALTGTVDPGTNLPCRPGVSTLRPQIEE